jgi:hypothetical protein
MAKDNRPAAQLTGTEFFPADTAQPLEKYIQPRVNQNSLDIEVSQDPNKLKSQDLNFKTARQRVSAGDPGSKVINQNGETITRGNGAAIRGIKARGPMA